MLIKSLIFFFVLFSRNQGHLSAVDDSEFIELGCQSDNNKPFYKIIFYLDGYRIDSNSNNAFTVHFEINKNVFLHIKNIIESTDFMGNYHANSKYYFEINSKATKRIYFAEYVEPIELIFKKICLTIYPITDIYERLRNIFSQTLRRLGSKVVIE